MSMEQLVYKALRGAVSLYKEYKKGLNELGEYQDDVDELQERVDAVLPIIDKVEGILCEEFVTTLQLAKRYLDRIIKALDSTKEYVNMCSGKFSGLKVLAVKACGMAAVSSLGLSDAESKAAAFLQSKFAGTTPEKMFDQLADRLQAAVGQLTLAISTQTLMAVSGGSMKGPVPSQLSMGAEERKQTEFASIAFVNTANPDESAPTVPNDDEKTPATQTVDVSKLMTKSQKKKMEESAKKVSLLEMIREQFNAPDPTVVIFLPPVRHALTRFHLVVVKYHDRYYYFLNSWTMAMVTRIRDLEEFFKKLDKLLLGKNMLERGTAFLKLYKLPLNYFPSQYTERNIYLGFLFPLRQARLFLRDKPCCEGYPLQGQFWDILGSGEKTAFYIDFKRQQLIVNGTKVEV